MCEDSDQVASTASTNPSPNNEKDKTAEASAQQMEQYSAFC